MVAHGAAEPKLYDGSELRIGIVHARWNAKMIDALLAGAKKSLKEAGVKDENIILQTVPGSYELPFAVQRMYASSQVQSSSSASGGGLIASATDLLSSTSVTDLTATSTPAASKQPASTASTAPFDAIIAIGVLVKGETMHFEYIADSVSHGLMKVQLDSQVPVIFGLLTVLNEEQGLARAGIAGASGSEGHCHGLDWGSAAVELGVKRRAWAKGEMID
ncbi:hypothetical protein BLS_005822 [Venturia inaequalis]|uniref:6,7-dimethyl-8-ribityllumazine synthase n=1 Tax=Venturia inaequalis TaxID=5025 RepID=A0A8H3VNM8_VENIN|nr:hypothetical protein EG328_003974 [Venturia inaequalis]KAE9982573.1 hypothetical protein BLS_005822 [Venturia inaequalis]KAE9991260.1 hypothetical protein EG327_000205 [Venturia inaequalis]RDI79604.1 hypothetical protein Vi05172_g10384 [Venturia inaequalis]